MTTVLTSWGFLDGSVVKNPPANARRYKFDPWLGKIPWRKEWQPTPVFLLGKSHGQRSLGGYSPWLYTRVGHDSGTKQQFSSVQFSSVTHLCLTLCDPMNQSMLGLPVYHQLPESTQTHVHWVGDGIQPSYPLSSPSPPALNPSQHQGLFKWVSSLHQVAKVLEFHLQHQSFQWTPRTDLL